MQGMLRVHICVAVTHRCGACVLLSPSILRDEPLPRCGDWQDGTPFQAHAFSKTKCKNCFSDVSVHELQGPSAPEAPSAPEGVRDSEAVGKCWARCRTLSCVPVTSVAVPAPPSATCGCSSMRRVQEKRARDDGPARSLHRVLPTGGDARSIPLSTSKTGKLRD